MIPIGDRRHLIIKPEQYRADQAPPAPIYVYVHSLGTTLAVTVKEALTRGRSRWDDPTYLARIIVSDVFAAAGIGALTGAGLSTDYMEGASSDDIVVDLGARSVHIGERSWTFESYIGEHDVYLIR